MLQSDIKSALKSAFENLDGPLTVADWCKGRSLSVDGTSTSDGSFAESTLSECKDSLSSATLNVGDAMSPAQPASGGSSLLKGILVVVFPMLHGS